MSKKIAIAALLFLDVSCHRADMLSSSHVHEDPKLVNEKEPVDTCQQRQPKLCFLRGERRFRDQLYLLATNDFVTSCRGGIGNACLRAYYALGYLNDKQREKILGAGTKIEHQNQLLLFGCKLDAEQACLKLYHLWKDDLIANAAPSKIAGAARKVATSLCENGDAEACAAIASFECRQDVTRESPVGSQSRQSLLRALKRAVDTAQSLQKQPCSVDKDACSFADGILIAISEACQITRKDLFSLLSLLDRERTRATRKKTTTIRPKHG